MDKDEFLTREFTHHKAEFEAGDKLALHHAILLAAWNGAPIPQWAVPELESILNLHAAGGFKRGKGIAGPRDLAERNARDRSMHWHVHRLMSLSDTEWRMWVGDVAQTQSRAFDEVAETFTRAFRERPDRKIFTGAMVKAAFYRVERRGSKKADTSGSDKP